MSEKGLLDRLTETKLSYKKLGLWLLLGLILISVFSNLEIKYPKNVIDKGFRFGYKGNNFIVFAFAFDQDSYNFIDQYDYVYSDIDIYILSKEKTSYIVTIKLYDQLNETLKVLVYNNNYSIYVDEFEFYKETLKMPKLKDKIYYGELLINDFLLIQFYFRFNNLYEEIKTTIGNMLMIQLMYIVIGFMIILMGLFIAKGLSNITALPDPDLNTAFWLILLSGLTTYYIAKELIYTYGITNSYYFFVFALIFSILAGIFIVGEKSSKLLLLRVFKDEKKVEVHMYKIKEKDTEIYKTPNIIEFLFFKPTKFNIKKEQLFNGVTKYAKYVLYYDNIVKKNDRIEVELTDSHLLDIEAFKQNTNHVYILSKSVRELREKVDELTIKLEKGEFDRDLGFLNKLIGEVIDE